MADHEKKSLRPIGAGSAAAWAKERATAPEQVVEVRRATELPFLIPGVGAQGGDLEGSVRGAWNGDRASTLVSSSRSVIYAKSPAHEAEGLKRQINAAVGARK